MRGSLGCLQRRAGKQEVAGALRARATPRLCLLAEEEEDKGGRRWAGPAGGAGPATGKWPRWAAGKVSLPLSVFPILLLFSII